jgi:hypothetical protein
MEASEPGDKRRYSRTPVVRFPTVILWIGVTVFLALGVIIGLSIATIVLAHGTSSLSAVVLGACAGGCGALFTFFVIFNVAQRLRMWMV